MTIQTFPRPLNIPLRADRRWRAESLSPEELDGGLLDIWRKWAQCDAAGAAPSPFLTPEWTRRLHQHDSRVRVVVVECDGELAGFLPWESHGKLGLPAGDQFNDLQGFIQSPELAVSIPIERVLQQCGLRSFRFRHWRQPSDSLRPHCWESHPFYFIDLSSGFAAYEESRRGKKRNKLRREMGRHKRRAEAEIGPLAVRWSDDQQTLARLLEWKQQQAIAMGWDNLDVGQAKALMQCVQPAAGQLSTSMAELYLGDHPVAAEFYLEADGRRLHAWMRAYDVEFARFAPGHLLFWEAARQAAARGVQRIDWGSGEDAFKSKFASGTIPVHSGWADTARWRSNLRRVATRWIHRLHLGPLAQRFRG